jgi:hypothetical protein
MIIVTSYAHVFAAVGFLVTLIYLLLQIAASPDIPEVIEVTDATEASVTDMFS